MEIKENIENNQTEILLSGEFSLVHIKELHERLIGSLKEATHLSVNLAEVTSIDLSFVQLLISLQETAQNWDKPYNLKGLKQNKLMEQIAELGFEQYPCFQQG